MAVILGTSVDRTVYLALADEPATGIFPGDVVCKYKKDGDNALTTKVLDGDTWVELAGGFYVLRFTPEEMNTAGFFFYTLEGADFDNFLFDEFTIEPAASVVSPLVPPDVCIVRGSIMTLGAQLPATTRIVARPVEFPATVSGSFIQAEPVVTFADAEGFFSLRLIRNSVVIIEIDRAGIRHQVTIPNLAEVQLKDLLPPSIVDYS